MKPTLVELFDGVRPHWSAEFIGMRGGDWLLMVRTLCKEPDGCGRRIGLVITFAASRNTTPQQWRVDASQIEYREGDGDAECSMKQAPLEADEEGAAILMRLPNDTLHHWASVWARLLLDQQPAGPVTWYGKGSPGAS